MITFSRKGTEVLVDVKHGVFFGEEYFRLEIHQAYEYQAELLLRQLDKNLSSQLERIRKEAYEQGFKDAKAKRAKQTWFSGRWK